MENFPCSFVAAMGGIAGAAPILPVAKLLDQPGIASTRTRAMGPMRNYSACVDFCHFVSFGSIADGPMLRKNERVSDRLDSQERLDEHLPRGRLE